MKVPTFTDSVKDRCVNKFTPLQDSLFCFIKNWALIHMYVMSSSPLWFIWAHFFFTLLFFVHGGRECLR